MLVRPDGIFSSWNSSAQHHASSRTMSTKGEETRIRSALTEISPNNFALVGNGQGVHLQNPAYNGPIISKDIIRISAAPISRPLTANATSFTHAPAQALHASGRGISLTAKSNQIYCDQNLIILSQSSQSDQSFCENSQPTPTFTFPNTTPVVRKRRKPSARKAAVAAGYNPLLSPIVEDRFAELPSPVRLATANAHGSERLVETDSATAGERVVIASHFALRPFFQKYLGRSGTRGHSWQLRENRGRGSLT